MKKTSGFDLPKSQASQLKRGVRLELITLAYMIVVVVMMGLVMGSSQAMRAAWIEDMLVLVPPVAFLIGCRVRKRAPTDQFPYGYHRAVSIGFLASAVALMGFGLFLLFEAMSSLIRQDHPTIGSIKMFGFVIWQGWLMLPVLIFSAAGPVVLGHLMIGPAGELHDKVLYATSQMLKADWLTAGAAFIGVLGIAIGWWWADAAAAAVISLDVLHDGWRNLKAVIGDLMDRAPETTNLSEPDKLPEEVLGRLRELPWVRDADLRMHENGHVLFGEVFIVPVDQDNPVGRIDEALSTAKEVHWRVHTVVVQLVENLKQLESPDGETRGVAEAPPDGH